MAVDLARLDPRLAAAVRHGREAYPVVIAQADDADPWPVQATDAVRLAFEDGSFRSAMTLIEAESPDLALE